MHRQRFTLFLLAALAAVLATAGAAVANVPAGNTGWYWANPLPQGNSLDQVVARNGRVWAAGKTGTLLHSEDRGATWGAVRTGLLDDIRVVDAISSNEVVFGGSCALRRSDDGGITVRRLPWSASDDGCPAKIQAVSFPSSLVGFLLLTNGDIYMTADGGGSWQKRSVAPQPGGTGQAGSAHDLHFVSPQKGVLSVGNRILYSIDGGAQWTPVANAGANSKSFSFGFVDDLHGFAVGDHSELLRTQTGGATWETVGSDGATLAQTLNGISCSTEDRCLASIANSNQLLRTTDGGETWLASTPGGDAIAAATYVHGDAALAVGVGGASFASSDSGATWSRVDRRAVGIFSGVHVASKKRAIAFGPAGSIAVSSDSGNSWQSLPAPTADHLVDATAAGRRVLALGASGALMTSDDGGNTWDQKPISIASRPRALVAWSDGRVVLVGRRGVRVSKKWGVGARRAKGPAGGMTLDKVDSAGRAVFAYGHRRIALSKDRGRTWLRVSGPRRSGEIVKLDMVSARDGYLLDDDAEVFVTRTGGRKWQRLETTGANSAVSIAFGDRRHGYISDATGRILATSDAGATWSRQYPFFDASNQSPIELAGYSSRGAIALVSGTNRLYATQTAGRIGNSSVLTIKPATKRVRKGTVVPVTGKLTRATGVERVAVLARVIGAPGGTAWVTQNVTVSASGTFTTKWKITAPTEFIARWSGDAMRDGDAAPLKTVLLRR